MAIQIKRIYEAPSASDGQRLLIDRLWPRGISKEKARLDGWPKVLAPSSALRAWFGHKAENFEKFAALYRAELNENPEAQAAARMLLAQSKKGTVTLLYGASNTKLNQAVVLKAYLEELAGKE